MRSRCGICEPGGCIDEPCYNCGTYSHYTEYCTQDTIHTCGRSHTCPERPPCDCAQKSRYIATVVYPAFVSVVGQEVADRAWPYDYRDGTLIVKCEGSKTAQVLALLRNQIREVCGFDNLRIRVVGKAA